MKIVFPYDGYENLGIGYLSSIAINNGFKVTLHLLSFGDYIRGHRDIHPGKIEKEKEAILRLKPDVVTFSINSFMAYPMIRLARSLRQSGIKTIAGGPHCTAEPSLCAASSAFNAVVAGEADDCFINSIESVINDDYAPDWIFTSERQNASYVFPNNLDILPFPAKKLFYDVNRFEAEDYKIITSRGCLRKCTFCSHSNPMIKSGFRRRSIGNVINELMSAKENYPVRSVYFLDDFFNSDKQWLMELMKDYRRYVGLPFHAICNPYKIDDELSLSLSHAGCFAIRVGVQTTVEESKRKLGRKETNENVKAAINSLKFRKIKVEVDHIVDLPGESPEDSSRSIDFYNTIRPCSIKVYWFMPLPGSVLFNEMRDQNLISSCQVDDIRNGKGFGRHSYLFYNRKYNSDKWLGIHLLLSYLPLLPVRVVSLLIRARIHRILRIPSFLLVVGIPRILNSGKWDKVGREHRKRILVTFRRKLSTALPQLP